VNCNSTTQTPEETATLPVETEDSSESGQGEVTQDYTTIPLSSKNEKAAEESSPAGAIVGGVVGGAATIGVTYAACKYFRKAGDTVSAGTKYKPDKVP